MKHIWNGVKWDETGMKLSEIVLIGVNGVNRCGTDVKRGETEWSGCETGRIGEK